MVELDSQSASLSVHLNFKVSNKEVSSSKNSQLKVQKNNLALMFSNPSDDTLTTETTIKTANKKISDSYEDDDDFNFRVHRAPSNSSIKEPKDILVENDDLKIDYQLFFVADKKLTTSTLPVDTILSDLDLFKIENPSILVYQHLERKQSPSSICSVAGLVNDDNKIRLIPNLLSSKIRLFGEREKLDISSYSCDHYLLKPIYSDIKSDNFNSLSNNTLSKFYAFAGNISRREAEKWVVGDPSIVNCNEVCSECLENKRTQLVKLVLQKTLFLSLILKIKSHENISSNVGEYFKSLFSDLQIFGRKSDDWLSQAKFYSTSSDHQNNPLEDLIWCLSAGKEVDPLLINKQLNNFTTDQKAIINFILHGLKDAAPQIQMPRFSELNKNINALVVIQIDIILKLLKIEQFHLNQRLLLSSKEKASNRIRKRPEIMNYLNDSISLIAEWHESLAMSKIKETKLTDTRLSWQDISNHNSRIIVSSLANKLIKQKKKATDKPKVKLSENKRLVRDSLDNAMTNASLRFQTYLLNWKNTSEDPMPFPDIQTNDMYSEDDKKSNSPISEKNEQDSQTYFCGSYRCATVKKSLFSRGLSGRVKTDFSEDEDEIEPVSISEVVCSGVLVQEDTDILFNNSYMPRAPSAVVSVNKAINNSTKDNEDEGCFLTILGKGGAKKKEKVPNICSLQAKSKLSWETPQKSPLGQQDLNSRNQCSKSSIQENEDL